MKTLRNLFLFTVVFAVSFVAAVRSPSVQKVVAVRYLKRHFSRVYLGRISVGATSAKIENLSLSLKNADFRVADCKISWSLKPLLVLRELKIEDVIADGVFISLHERTPHKIPQKRSLLGIVKDAYG
ncbi:MAG: hypothetical protein LBB18_02295, partial [Puniceicoccales bacterium]|nr:hypothetical protein [Puniceicoccales bacterium]